MDRVMPFIPHGCIKSSKYDGYPTRADTKEQQRHNLWFFLLYFILYKMVLTLQVLQTIIFESTTTLFSLRSMFRLCTWEVQRDQTSGGSDNFNTTFLPFGFPQIKSKNWKLLTMFVWHEVTGSYALHRKRKWRFLSEQKV